MRRLARLLSLPLEEGHFRPRREGMTLKGGVITNCRLGGELLRSWKCRSRNYERCMETICRDRRSNQMTRPAKAKPIERLRKVLDAIPKLKQFQHDSQDFNMWRRDTQVAIVNTFVDKPSYIHTFNRIPFSLTALSYIDPIPDVENPASLCGRLGISGFITRIHDWGD